MRTHVSVDEWVSMFREVGLDDAGMKKWHQIFESRHPEGHQSFLEWLGLSDKDIAQIRADHR